MKSARFHDVTEVFSALRDLRREIEQSGWVEAAQALTYVIDGFWTTSSEALTQVLDVIREVQEVYGAHLSPSQRALVIAISECARVLLKFK